MYVDGRGAPQVLQNKGWGRGVAGSRLPIGASRPHCIHTETVGQSSCPLKASKMCVTLSEFLISEMPLSHRIPMSTDPW